MPTIIRAEYLSYYNASRNSDKLFNIFLIQEDNETFSCLTENGRRGSNLVRRTVCQKVRRETAESKFWEKVREKCNHRETPYSIESFGNSYSQIASEYASQSQTRNVVNTNQNKSVEPKANVIPFPAEKSESQSKKPNSSGILNSNQLDSLEI
ncbi:MAG TPA: hypothetical protein PKY82_15130 [Pyrinomonadaceae bacterium]|nr:hypothetical protein [Pyrinomonadaceae bacterium]